MGRRGLASSREKGRKQGLEAAPAEDGAAFCVCVGGVRLEAIWGSDAWWPFVGDACELEYNERDTHSLLAPCATVCRKPADTYLEGCGCKTQILLFASKPQPVVFIGLLLSVCWRRRGRNITFSPLLS